MRSVVSDSHAIGTRVGCFMVGGVRRMPPSLRHQIQELLRMRGTPARLANGGPAEAPRGVVEPPPQLVEVRVASSQDVGASPPTRVAEAGHQTRDATPSGVAATHPRPDEAMNQAATSSSTIVSSGGEHAKGPPSRERFRCLMSRDQEDAQSHALCRCPELWSTRKAAQVAREMVTTTTLNANVELPKEQRAQRAQRAQREHLTWEVPFNSRIKLPEERQIKLPEEH